MKSVFVFGVLLFFSVAVFASEPAWEESPYRIRIYVSPSSEVRLPREFAKLVRERCATHWGIYWTVQVEEPTLELLQHLQMEFSELPEDWTQFDKVFVAAFSSERLELREFDTATRWRSEKHSFPLGGESKLEDVLLQGLHEVFSPIGRVEQTAAEHVTLLLRGKNLLPSTASIRADIFLPFVRTLDRDAKLIQVERIPWTVLVAESEESKSLGLRYRTESGVRSPLSQRRRGRTEIYALAVPSPPTATQLRFVPRSKTEAKNIGTLPPYSVYEKVPGEKDVVLVGKTATDGSFLLEPSAERAVRFLQIRDDSTLIVQFPIVRGLESVTTIPVPDDVIRLEAEAALLGIQEAMIDQVARRGILNLREKKFREAGDSQQLRDVRSELLRMKDAARYHLELNQLRDRLHSEDPIVERRIDRLFRDTRKMVDAFLR